jgi:indoleamine 2,3-dioxygenase
MSLARFFNPPEATVLQTERGFLPKTDPLSALPRSSEFNEALNQLSQQLPALLHKKKFRTAIDELNKKYAENFLKLERGNSAEKDTAILILALLAQAYIWEDNHLPASKLPSVLARNLYALCKSERRFPTLTYSDYVLNNWKLKAPEKGLQLDNLEPLFTFTATKDEAWFIVIHVAIEAAAAKALEAAQKAQWLCYSPVGELAPKDFPLLKTLLDQIQTSLKEATGLLSRMYEHCQPDFFWKVLRPYLNGWEKVKKLTADGKEEIGVRFEGVPTKDLKPTHHYKGSSGAQSSILPALDAALGVTHEIDGMFQTLLLFKFYMPLEHQIVISLFSRSKIKQAVKLSHCPELWEAWEKAVEQIKAFRKGHLGLVAHYIYSAAEKQGVKREEITGTGGTGIHDYLVNRHESTQATLGQLRAKL